MARVLVLLFGFDFSFWDSVSCCDSDWPGTHYIARTILESVEILLLRPPWFCFLFYTGTYQWLLNPWASQSREEERSAGAWLRWHREPYCSLLCHCTWPMRVNRAMLREYHWLHWALDSGSIWSIHAPWHRQMEMYHCRAQYGSWDARSSQDSTQLSVGQPGKQGLYECQFPVYPACGTQGVWLMSYLMERQYMVTSCFSEMLCPWVTFALKALFLFLKQWAPKDSHLVTKDPIFQFSLVYVQGSLYFYRLFSFSFL